MSQGWLSKIRGARTLPGAALSALAALFFLFLLMPHDSSQSLMKLSDLDYYFPEDLVALKPLHPPRVWLNRFENSAQNFKPRSEEIAFEQVFDLFEPGDVLLVNDTRVEKRRVVSAEGLEVLFIGQVAPREWEVLCPAKALAVGDQIHLPGGQRAQLLSKGLPQRLRILTDWPIDYFLKNGEPALPPYIQKARQSRRAQAEDETWYQTDWAASSATDGSAAAPTASLHFKKTHLELLTGRGVEIGWLTLNVGLGTFLPVKTENLLEHKMHGEWVEIPRQTLEAVSRAKSEGGRVWALGTTAMRSIEAWAMGQLSESINGSATGVTDLFILPGYEFKVVEGLLTNFHQPRSTLLALVGAFYGMEPTLVAYNQAIEKRFRLFSYGDLSIWMPPQ